MKINKLTKEQESYLPKYREDARQRALCTESIDNAKSIDSVKNLYSAAGLQEPDEVLCFSSPAACLVVRGLLNKTLNFQDQLGGQLRDQLRDQLRGQLEHQLWGQLGGQLGDQLRWQLRWQLRDQLQDQLGDQLGDQLQDQLGDQLGDQLWYQLRDQLGDQLQDQLGDQLGDQLEHQLWYRLWDQLRGQLQDQLGFQLGFQLRDQLWGHLEHQLRGQLGGQLRDQLGGQLRGRLRGQLRGQLGGQLGDQLRDQDFQESLWFSGGWDNYWLAFYDFARKIGVKYNNQNHFDAYLNYANNCGVMYAYKNIALVSDRPKKLKFDDRKLLHCEDGYAIEYRDGWGFCSWHGTRIPEEWILKKSLDAQTAITWENIEQRRAACEIIGWAKILRELNARTIHKSSNPFVGELVEVDLPDIGKERYLRVMCGTDREFALPVPPSMQRAAQAQAWINIPDENWQQYESIFENVTVRT